MNAVADAPVLGLEGLPELLDSDQENLLDAVQAGGLDLSEDSARRDLGRLSDEATGRRHLSHSSVSTLLACPQKYGFSYDLGIERIGKALPLSMGSAFQKGIEEGDPAVAIDTFVKSAGPVFEQADEDHRRIHAAIVGAAASAYLKAYGTAPDSQREVGLRVRLRNPWTGAYSRTFDLLSFVDEFTHEDGEPVLTENKLVGQISELSIRKLPLDRQIALSCYGLWRATGEKVSRVRYRWTRKPSIRQKKGESVEEFCERVVADYEARPDFYLHEENVHRSPADLVRIEAELWEWAERVRASEKRAMWPRNTSYCHEYGGCEFLPICLGDPDAMALYQPKASNGNAHQTQEEANE